MGISLPSGTTLTVETKLFPPLVVDLTGKTPPSAGGVVAGLVTGLALKIVKPKVSVQLAGTTVAAVAPGGEPGANHWHTTRIVLLVLLGFAAFKVVRILV
jgi:hypothetical protein